MYRESSVLYCVVKRHINFFEVIDELRFRIFENRTSKEIDHNLYYYQTALNRGLQAMAGDSLYL